MGCLQRSSALVLGVVLAASVSAQERKWNLHFGGGPSFARTAMRDFVNRGYHFGGGGGVNLTPQAGLVGEFRFNSFGVNDQTLRRFEMPDGRTYVWNVSLNPTLRLNPNGRLGGYVIGGYGVYRRTIEFTQPTLRPTVICDFWWGFCSQVLVPANQVLGRFSTTRGGWNGGGGVTFGLGRSGTKLFVEMRYHQMLTSSRSTQFAPLTAGLRW
jgi:hypothetical protein